MMMQWWADHLDRLRGANVAPIKKGAAANHTVGAEPKFS